LPTDRSARIGVLLAAIGAMSYGVTVVVGEDLADAGFGPTTSLGVRFAVGGALLAAVLRIRREPIVPSRRVVLTGLGLGVAYALESTFFFSALERGSAAATALVFYVYPAMVLLVELARGRERPHRRTFVALGLSSAGAAVVVVAGGSLSISAAGVAFALASAATFSAYLLVGREFSDGVDSMTMACWVAIGASLSNLGRGVVTHELVDPSSRALEIVLYGASTAAAFTLMFAAMHRIGAARVAVVMTLEAVASVAMAAAFLHESITAVQALGGAAVLAAAVIIARAGAQHPDPALDEYAPATQP
jgi:drug/metabolite transporter (DMT)-like permease